ncbi:MAG: hypothetical protein U5N56_11875 [Candidatus Marinimicrobia bacterium]|nr:hypothetical protein [Candidatus Neomarinimicrobiota bacterium]
MRFKILCAVIFLTLFTFIFAQESKSRAEFFKEFYGTFISSSDIEIDSEKKAEDAVDLTEVIQDLKNATILIFPNPRRRILRPLRMLPNMSIAILDSRLRSKKKRQ